MDPSKVKAVTDWPVPDSRSALQRFLGFANFYRCFIRNFSQVAVPLTALASAKSCFVWSGAALHAFVRLKRLFASAPVLISPDPENRFIIEVDASDIGVGAMRCFHSAPHLIIRFTRACFIHIDSRHQNVTMTWETVNS